MGYEYLDILKNLTDNEREAIFATAIDETEKRQIPFEEAIVEVIKAFLEEKERLLEEQRRNARQQEMQPSIPNNFNDFVDPFGVDAEELTEGQDIEMNMENGDVADASAMGEEEVEEQQEFDDPTMAAAIASFYDSFDADVQEASQDIEFGDPRKQIIDDAKKGKITDYDKYFESKKQGAFGMKGLDLASKFTEIIKRINSSVRGAYYTHLERSNDKTLNDERERSIGIWEALATMGKEFEGTLTQQDRDRHSSASISFDDLVAMNTKNGRSARGMDALFGSMDDGPNTFDPTCYDDEYGVARGIVGNKDKGSFVEKVFSGAMGKIAEKIEKLQGMSAGDYKQYKLGQLRLQPGEKEMYDAQLNDFEMNHSQAFTDEGLEGPRK